MIAAAAASLGALAAPASAPAVVYCVPNLAVHPSCEDFNATVDGALTTAGGTTAVADTVRIGAGDFPVTNAGYVDTANVDNTVQVTGASSGITTLTLGTTTGGVAGLVLNTVGPSSVSELAITIPAADDMMVDTGLILAGATAAHDVLVNGPASTFATGLSMGGTSTLDDSTVNLPEGASGTSGVRQDSGSPTITDSTLQAQTGVSHSGDGATTNIDRSTIRASFSGAALDSGTIVARNTLIDLGAQDSAVGVRVHNSNVGDDPLIASLDGVTIVGSGINQVGVRSRADDGTETATAFLFNTIIDGVPTAIQVLADEGRSSTVETSYSNYDAMDVEVDNDLNNDTTTGTSTYTPSNLTSLPPAFVNPATGNYHLQMTSPLLDIGNPIAPGAGALDIDGNARALSATGTCAGPVAGRRDIGADEFVPGIPAGCETPPILTPAPLTTPLPPGISRKRCKKRKKTKRAVPAAKRCKKKRR